MLSSLVITRIVQSLSIIVLQHAKWEGCTYRFGYSALLVLLSFFLLCPYMGVTYNTQINEALNLANSAVSLSDKVLTYYTVGPRAILQKDWDGISFTILGFTLWVLLVLLYKVWWNIMLNAHTKPHVYGIIQLSHVLQSTLGKSTHFVTLQHWKAILQTFCNYHFYTLLQLLAFLDLTLNWFLSLCT